MTLKADLQELEKSLKQLVQKTEQMGKRLNKFQKAPVPKKSRAKTKTAKKLVPQKSTQVTATDTVLGIIKRSKKAVDTATLKEKTGFKDNKIWPILGRLKKQGKIKSERKGVYEKA